MLHRGHGTVTRMLKAAGMDNDTVHSIFLSLTTLSEKLRAAREALSFPNGKESALGDLLYVLECDVRLTAAKLVDAPGFSICRSFWPPELLTADDEVRAAFAELLRESTAKKNLPPGKKTKWSTSAGKTNGMISEGPILKERYSSRKR
jgi:hypothetical protein